MPCQSDGYPDMAIAELRKKVDDLTRMLCSLLGTIGNDPFISPEIREWYKIHREWDKSQGRP